MYLVIDTTDIEKLFVGLIKNKHFFKLKASAKYKQSEKLLFFIAKILKENKVKLDQIKGIAVVTGPGGFTTVRIGIATVNALVWALNVKAVGIKDIEFTSDDDLFEKVVEKMKKAKKQALIMPFYGKEPNITKPKV